MSKENPVVAIAGVTGVVGREMLLILEQRGFPAAQLKVFASSRSAGRKIEYEGKGALGTDSSGKGYVEVEELRDNSFAGVDIALFSAGSAVSKELRQAVVQAGAIMIDNSSAFRMEEGVPLVVPEVNPQDAFEHKGVIANPNCSTIQLVVVLDALAKVAPLTRVVCSTYQAASGGGAAAMAELSIQARQFLDEQDITIEKFAYRLAFNCIPQIDVFLEDGATKEEWKMVAETRKIMHAPDMALGMTCVRVPVLRCHSESINVEFAAPVSVAEARAALERAPGITVMDNPAELEYPMPGLLAGTDGVYVGRLRQDTSVAQGLALWTVADQLRKGAALNSVQIAELLLK